MPRHYRTTFGYGHRDIPLLSWLVAWANRGLGYAALAQCGVPEWDRDGWLSDTCLPALARCAVSHRPGRATYSTLAYGACLRVIRRTQQELAGDYPWPQHPSPAADPLAVAESPEQPDPFRAGTVRAAVNSLPPRLAFVVACRFWGGMTLQEVGDEVGLSPEWVRQLELQALDKLRFSLAADYPEM